MPSDNKDQDILNMNDSDFEKKVNSNFKFSSNDEPSENDESGADDENHTNSDESSSPGSDHLDNEHDQDDTNGNSSDDNIQNNDNQVDGDESEEDDNTDDVESQDNEDDEEDSNDEINDHIDINDLPDELKTLKVRGKKVKIRSIDHLKSLAQQGMNASKTLSELKPAKKIVATLEKYGLYGSEQADTRLKMLIDAANGEKEAINALIKQSGIDIDEFILDDDNDSNYNPKADFIPESDLEMRDIQNQLSNSPLYGDLTKELRSYDDDSKIKISSNPSYILGLHTDMENGIYDKISAEIEYQKGVGLIDQSMPFIDAYIQIANSDISFEDDSHKKKTVRRRKKVGNMNTPKAKPTTSKKQKKQEDINPLLLPDDYFNE